jgi:hypothetical protein
LSLERFVTLTVVILIDLKTLTINYGNLSNHDLLLRHGILIENNPYNQIQIKLDFGNYVSYSSQAFELKQKLYKNRLYFSFLRLRESEIDDIEHIALFSNRINS